MHSLEHWVTLGKAVPSLLYLFGILRMTSVMHNTWGPWVTVGSRIKLGGLIFSKSYWLIAFEGHLIHDIVSF